MEHIYDYSYICLNDLEFEKKVIEISKTHVQILVRVFEGKRREKGEHIQGGGQDQCQRVKNGRRC